MAASAQHRCVFVGNIPYDATEEQLIEICREVGPVVSFRLVVDRETGKPKGYGFCEYKDEETALSARRNLQGYEINGRQLRVDFAENDKNTDRNKEQGRQASNTDPRRHGGPPANIADATQHQPIGLHIAMTAATVMTGALGATQTAVQPNHAAFQGQSALTSDPLTLHLAKMSRSQLNEVMTELKVMATQNREAARQLLLERPQLPKALFQVPSAYANTLTSLVLFPLFLCKNWAILKFKLTNVVPMLSQAQIMLGMVTPEVLQMPNIRAPSSQLALPPLQDTQQGKHALQTLAGSALPSQGTYPSLVTQVPGGRSSVVPLNPSVQDQVSTSPMHPPNKTHVLPQALLPGKSVVPIPLPAQPITRPPNQATVDSSLLTQQIQQSIVQNPGQSGGGNYGYKSQISLRPFVSETSTKPEPLMSSGISDPGSMDARPAIQVPDEATRYNRNMAYRQANTFQDPSEPSHRPTKLLKLDEGRNTSSSIGDRNMANNTGFGPSQTVPVISVPTKPLPKPEEKQAPQLAPDVESALLQQVLSLTPEQLSSLPPEQQQQVIQLQQALRRDQMQPS
ncbi:unnamed protein product [Linum tenue]|uniref:RRM domain-containing protein n=1 Tax=Linum tenue TaxID=586396 RepID=A0AAV0IH29_9ROSI|nr:unnamed protein product [Linum tenue]